MGNLKSLAVAFFSLIAILVTGYLASQTEGMLNGYLLDWTGLPSVAVVMRFPWELALASILFGFAAVAAYRRTVLTRTAQVVVLTILLAAAIVAGFSFVEVHTTRTNIFTIAFVNGGASPLNLAFIAFVLADLLLIRPELGRHRNESRDSHSIGPLG
jgi:hypothetical protein